MCLFTDSACLLRNPWETSRKRRDPNQRLCPHWELQGLHDAARVRHQTHRAEEDGGHAAGKHLILPSVHNLIYHIALDHIKLVRSVRYRTLSRPDSRRCMWSTSPGTSQPPITWWSPSWRASCWRGWVEFKWMWGGKGLNKVFTILANGFKRRTKDAWSNYFHFRNLHTGMHTH